MTLPSSTNVLILGAGAIGLSLAYELARRGQRVRVLERGHAFREASWAGAGILPPATRALAVHAYDQLRALSFELHAEWAERLLRETGMDTGYRRCGGIYLTRRAGEGAALRAWMRQLHEEQIEAQLLSPSALVELEPGLASVSPSVGTACVLPGECQIRNPRWLAAVLSAARQSGAEIHEHTEVTGIELHGSRVQTVHTSRGPFYADTICVASGAWTRQLLTPLGCSLRMGPVRGQMVLFRCPHRPLTHIVNEGSRYLVPRDDGRVLAGSTEEEVGFDKSTTPSAIAELTDFARALLPALATAEVEQAWAGLRPATHDGLPYLGAVPGCENLFVAAGHFRSGLYLAPGTAHVMAELLCHQRPAIDLTPFSPARG